MANYPNSLPGLSTSNANSTASNNTHPALHNSVNDETNAIAAELGVQPSGSFATVVARLDSLGSGGSGYWVDPMNHGAAGDGVTDDQTALAAAISAIPAEGGTLLIRKKHVHSGTLNFSGKRSVVIQGTGGMSSGLDTAAQLIYTGSTANSAYNFQGCVGLHVRDIWMRTTLTGFSSRLLDFRGDQGPGTGSQIHFDHCFISAPTAATGATLVDLSGGTHVSDWYSCHFNGGGLAIKGGNTTPVIVNNAHRFFGCHFQNHALVPISNPTHVWSFYGCTWQPLQSGAAGAINFSGSNSAKVLSLYGCWMGDSNTSGIWIEVPGNAQGVTITSCQFGPGAKSVVVGAFSFGIMLIGNEFASTVPYDIGTNPTNLFAMGNYIYAAPTIAGTPVSSVWETGTTTTPSGMQSTVPMRTVNNTTEQAASASNRGQIWFNTDTGTFRGSTGSAIVSLS